MLLNKSHALLHLKRYADAVVAYGWLVERFGDDETFEMRMIVAQTLNNKGLSLDDQNDPENALSAYGQVIDRFRENDGSLIQEKAVA